MKREFAKSLSGHDRGRIYLIWKTEERFAYLVDGKAHTIEKPKKKNKKHYQVVKRIPEEILAQFQENEPPADETVYRMLKAYRRFISKQ